MIWLQSQVCHFFHLIVSEGDFPFKVYRKQIFFFSFKLKLSQFENTCIRFVKSV